MSSEAPLSVDETLWKVRNFRRLGNFIKARALLDPLPLGTLQQPTFALEYAHVCLTQGYYSRAIQFLEQLVSENEPTDTYATMALRLQLAAAEIHNRGKFQNAKILQANASCLLPLQ